MGYTDHSMPFTLSYLHLPPLTPGGTCPPRATWLPGTASIQLFWAPRHCGERCGDIQVSTSQPTESSEESLLWKLNWKILLREIRWSFFKMSKSQTKALSDESFVERAWMKVCQERSWSRGKFCLENSGGRLGFSLTGSGGHSWNKYCQGHSYVKILATKNSYQHNGLSIYYLLPCNEVIMMS